MINSLMRPRASATLRFRLFFVSFAFFLSFNTGLAQSNEQNIRPFTLDDMFNLEGVPSGLGSAFAFSPDGRQVAFAIQRPKRTAKTHTGDLLQVNRADIYVVSSSAGEPAKITNGLSDDSSYLCPSWSPDGQRLAMLSNKGGDVHLWVWDQKTGLLKKVSDRPIDLNYNLYRQPFVWISATRILVPVAPRGEKSMLAAGYKLGPEYAIREWSKTWNGREPAVSVLRSGIPPKLDQRPQGALVDIDIRTGANRIVKNGTVRTISVSPDGKAVAFLLKVESFQPEAKKPLPLNELFRDRAGRFALEIIRLSDGSSLLPPDPVTNDVMPASLEWSPNGDEIAFLSYTGRKKTAIRLIRFPISSRNLVVTNSGGIDPTPATYQLPGLVWTSRGWMVNGSLKRNDLSDEPARRDWWLIGNDLPHAVTANLTNVPSLLLRAPGTDAYLGLADGALWRITPDNPAQNLTSKFGKRITSIIWPTEATKRGFAEAPSITYQHLLVENQIVGSRETFVFDLATSRLSPLALPETNARVAEFSPASRAIVYSINNESGLRLWVAAELSKQPSKIYEANTFIRKVTPGSHQLISYQSLDGKDLKGWLLLPPGYKPGKKYPLMVWVYPGWMAGPAPDPLENLSYESALNRQILAANGYVVLRPSVPFNYGTGPDDVILRLTSGVIPAVDKVIELGIADPNRVFAMGHSFGGYAIFGLVTQTHRFKAAVTLAGYSDMVSGYNQFGVWRYYDYSDEMLTATQQPGMESLLGFGVPPWSDFGRYLRNSPIFYVDRVETPLMIIHGEFDGMPMEQAEEFYMALYRQGKRAELVRYWGEGHVLISPANIRDMWSRIFAWLEEFSPKPVEREATGARAGGR